MEIRTFQNDHAHSTVHMPNNAHCALLFCHKTIESFFFLSFTFNSSNNNKPHFGHNAFDGHVAEAFLFGMDFGWLKSGHSIQLKLSFKLIKIVVKLLNFIWRLCSISLLWLATHTLPLNAAHSKKIISTFV